MNGHTVLEVLFFGEGRVLLDGSPLAFPYAKAKLLLFVLLETRKATRGQLCAWIWEEFPATARQNLRNALAALRHLLPEGCLVADRKTVRIDERCRISSDLDLLKDGADELDASSVAGLSAPFLDGLFPAGIQCTWIEERRSHYRQKLQRLLNRRIENAPPEERTLWQSFLRALPPVESEEDAYAKTPRLPPAEPPFVRVEERDAILAFMAEASPGPGILCSLLMGEEGSGKSALSGEIFSRKTAEGSLCFRGRCPEGEGNDPRAVWSRVLKKIVAGRQASDLGLSAFHLRYLASFFPELHVRPETELPATTPWPSPLMDFNPRLLGKIFAQLFDRLHRETRRTIFLLLEDIHRSDRLMPDLLHGLFENAPRLSVLLTCYPEFRAPLDTALNPPSPNLRLQETVLARLTYERTERICRSFIPERELTPGKLAEIYEYTGGNSFLLQEFLRFHDAEDWSGKLSKSLNELVHNRIRSLTEEEAELLDCVAVFQDEAPFDALRYLSGLEDTPLIRVYEKLHRRGLLYDRATGENFAILFRYPLVKKQIVSAMPEVKRWNLHRRMVAWLDRDTGEAKDRKNLALLTWHAHHAGDPMTELDARTHELKINFEFTHELFPMLSDAELLAFPGTTTDIRVTETALKEVRALLDRMARARGRTPQLLAFERTILTLEGGYLRWNGDYDDASGYLDEALKLAAASENRDLPTIEVLEQLCYLGIQKDDPALLRRYVFLFYRAAIRSHMGPQIGMGLRFLAILAIMEGRLEDATKLLGMSVRLFEKLESQGNGYTLSVIAAIHYHGDIAVCRGRHDQAHAHYQQCVKLCEGKGFFRGLGLYLAKSAWCAARLGHTDRMREYLTFALPLFEGLQSRRGAGMCGGEIVLDLSALLDIADGAFERGTARLRQAEELSRIIRKPLWNAMHYCVRALLKKHASPLLDAALEESAEHYLAEAKKRFDRLGLSHEIEAFDQMGRLFGPGHDI